MKELAYILLSIAALSCTGSATIIDLEDYLVDTGNVRIFDDPDGTVSHNGGKYAALALWPDDFAIFLSEVNDSALNASNFTAEQGFSPVKKPYPGYVVTDNTTNQVHYTAIHDRLLIGMDFANPQRALSLLSEISIIKREDYQAETSEELVSALN
jgi:hypothetical protein